MLLFLLLTSCDDSPYEEFSKEKALQNSAAIRTEKINTSLIPLKSKFKNFGPIVDGDWITTHSESGQYIADYKASKPNAVTTKRNKIYVLQIGQFSKEQLLVLDDTIKYMEACFGVPVVKLSAYAKDKIPLSARRRHPEWLHEQLNAKYIISDILLPSRPDDALALVGFTASDLYPGKNWSFVFGLASLTKRIGVWSIFRNGDPAESSKEYSICLRRTISTAIHETGHILGIRHCIAYECVMCGSNSREESDKRDLAFCPHCLDKLTWNTGVPAKERFIKLKKVSRQLGLMKEYKFFSECLELLPKKVVDK